MGRAPCCDKANVKKGPWSPEEDSKLKEYIEKNGTGGNWIALPQKAGLKRCGKSCRLRWLNYLRPNIKHGEFSDDEDRIICTLFASIGSRWSIMAAQLPGRTDNDIKNYWNTKLKKKLMNIMSSTTPGINPQFRKQHPAVSNLESFNPASYQSLSLFHQYNNNSINITTTSGYNNDQTLSIPSSPSAADHHHHGYMNVVPSMQSYNQVGKDSSALLMFGGSADQASCSSNSDGSYHYDHQYGDHLQRSGVYGDSSFDSSLEEIKQLISTNNPCSSGINSNNLNFFVDEIKAEEKVMYY